MCRWHTRLYKNGQLESTARRLVAQHTYLGLDLNIATKVRRSRGDDVVNEICDFAYEFIEGLYSEDGQGEWWQCR